MPWDAQSFKSKHNHSLTDAQAEKVSGQANAILKKTGDEGLAIAVANKNARKTPDSKVHSPMNAHWDKGKK